MPRLAPSAAPSTRLRRGDTLAPTLQCTAAREGGKGRRSAGGAVPRGGTHSGLQAGPTGRPPPTTTLGAGGGSRERPKSAPAAMPPCALSRKSRRPRYTPLSVCGAGVGWVDESVKCGPPLPTESCPAPPLCLAHPNQPAHLHAIKDSGQAAKVQPAAQGRVGDAGQALLGGVGRRWEGGGVRVSEGRCPQQLSLPRSTRHRSSTASLHPPTCVFSSAMWRAACSLVGASAGACGGAAPRSSIHRLPPPKSRPASVADSVSCDHSRSSSGIGGSWRRRESGGLVGSPTQVAAAAAPRLPPLGHRRPIGSP